MLCLMDSSPPRQQQQPVTRSHKTKLIVFSLLILLIGLTFWVSATLSSLARSRLSSIQADSFSRSAGSSRILNYCYLTAYPNLCFDSVPAFINQKAHLPKPDEVVSAVIRAAVHEFKSALPDGVGLPECRSEVERLMSGLNRSLAVLGVKSDLGRLSYEEEDVMIRWIAVLRMDQSEEVAGMINCIWNSAEKRMTNCSEEINHCWQKQCMCEAVANQVPEKKIIPYWILETSRGSQTNGSYTLKLKESRLKHFYWWKSLWWISSTNSVMLSRKLVL